MKRTISLVLAMIMALSLMPVTFAGAVTYHSGQEPPYSLQYLKDIGGIKYVKYEESGEFFYEVESKLYTDSISEIYDFLDGYNQDDVIYEVHNAFKKAGMESDYEIESDGSYSYFYTTAEDEQGGYHRYFIFPHDEPNKLIIWHCYLINPELAYVKNFDNFLRSATYKDGQFTDVKSSDWFVSGVKSAYELGLMKGDSETRFNPSGNMTVAETITIAARLHSIFTTGKAEFIQGDVWYETYVDYAIEHEIIRNERDHDYNKAITRNDFVRIMFFALPFEAWTPMNDVERIPDVDDSTNIGAAIKTLYDAGVLTGNDKYGRFLPDNNIQRSEVATILTRMAVPTERKKVQLIGYPTSLNMRTEANLGVGDSRYLHLELNFDSQEVDTNVQWTSSDPTIASVDNKGQITGKKPGVVNITVTAAGEQKATCKLTVWNRSDADERFATMALGLLLEQLKFPDTLQLNNIWAYSYGDSYGEYQIVIYI